MPITHVTFLVGCLALAGVPPLAGFWSKDAIVASLEEKSHAFAHAAPSGHDSVPQQGVLDEDTATRLASTYQALYWVALATGFLTALYTFRVFFLTFYGPERIPHEAGRHAHESPPEMWWPLVILALGAAFVGVFFDRTYTRVAPTNVLTDFLATTPSLAGGAVAATQAPDYQFHGAVAAISSAIALAGILLASYLYLGDTREIRWWKSVLDFEGFSHLPDARVLARWKQQPLIAALRRGAGRAGLGWLTTLVGYLLLVPGFLLAFPLLLSNYVTPYKLSERKFFLDELYQLTVVSPLRFVADACAAIDRWIVDGVVSLVGWIPLAMGTLMRSLQMGLVQFYAFAMFLGVLVLIATRFLWSV